MKTRQPGSPLDAEKLDCIVRGAQQSRHERHQGYREQSLGIHPWVCGRCGREFTRENLHQLTVHHKDHNHDHNPPDGSNWENLCVYCHDNEHRRFIDLVAGFDPHVAKSTPKPSTHKAFAQLGHLLKGKPAP